LQNVASLCVALPSPVNRFALPFYRFSSLRIALHRFALICTTLHHVASLYTVLYRVASPLYRFSVTFASLRIVSHHFASPLRRLCVAFTSHLHRFALPFYIAFASLCTALQHFASFSLLHRCISLCVTLYRFCCLYIALQRVGSFTSLCECFASFLPLRIALHHILFTSQISPISLGFYPLFPLFISLSQQF
jgi:hypothetical protein